MKSTHHLFVFLGLCPFAFAAEFHVSPQGSAPADGSAQKPFQTISAAAAVAQPGDTITVHAGVYRERVNPPRGGESDAKRIVYQAAPGEKVTIKGSEPAKGWQKAGNDTWKLELPNSFFGAFNPYRDAIAGDWFNGKGRVHHTGAVYLNGHWLTETADQEAVLKPAGETPLWYTDDHRPRPAGGYLLNVAWLRAGREGVKVAATACGGRKGTRNAPCSEGGECLGFIEDGHWVKYPAFDFGTSTSELEIRAAAVGAGGKIEVRLDRPDGELLGECAVATTGDWQKWQSFPAKIKPTGGKRTLCLVFRGLAAGATAGPSAGADVTTIWAQFKGIDPNQADVEINVRQTVFYPDKTGINFLTIRGFTMEHAATPWAPPTAEQIGLIGTNWSKGWVIEDNTVRYSTCSGIALGKHGDQFDNTSANSAEGYVKTIERATARGWSKENIGHHTVRGNHVLHCEQAGIVGSLGAVFSTITGNHIHHIHVRQLFTGAEQAGIKIHAAIDTLIADNHIHHTNRGLWLDWMAQGTRVSRNLFHDNNTCEDLFIEVDHGPMVVDNNLFLSRTSLLDMSEGAAFAHNLFAGRIVSRPEPRRETPYHPAHSTVVAGLSTIKGGDNRFYNNVFTGPTCGLTEYDARERPSFYGGNVFLNGAKPSAKDASAVVVAADPQWNLAEENGMWNLRWNPALQPGSAKTVPVTTELLGKAAVSGLAYENPDGSPLVVDEDFLRTKRDAKQPAAGSFEKPGTGETIIRLK